ncbi:uncharacterized protein PHALS_10271 [Plasmopara halstedii]|uniref:Uncharacterized protein n=1 Tax=Plasmopara halstedii TaxID=4781 RepID=A0A0P1AHA4_PLAHL|nr:uncharacterized protein PHALS_10271 [Plasmopara halstedii]CEG40049.1 hypothetical protein PHALS_10271 [Plasmopara halstedii]|eukprot:XP_024576418.1 hypothetical protein PHALS_10271 [Plasmopara halstedii]
MKPVDKPESVCPSPINHGFAGEKPPVQLPRPVFVPDPVRLTHYEQPSAPYGTISTTGELASLPEPAVAAALSDMNAHALVTPGPAIAPATTDADARAPADGNGATTRIVDVGAGMTVLVTGAAPVVSDAEDTVVLPSSQVPILNSNGDDKDESMMEATSLQLSLASTPVEPIADSTSAAQQSPATSGGETPSLGALLRRPTEIRRDRTAVSASNRVVLPRPCAADITAIDALYENGGDWASLLASVEQARPYELPRARYVMTIGTGRAFERTGINKIMASFLKENGNAVVTEQIKLQQLGQISKGRGGEI